MCLASPSAAGNKQVFRFIDPVAFLEQFNGMCVQQSVRFIKRLVEISIRIFQRSLGLELVELLCLPLIPFLVDDGGYTGMEVFQFSIRVQELTLQFFRHV